MIDLRSDGDLHEGKIEPHSVAGITYPPSAPAHVSHARTTSASVVDGHSAHGADSDDVAAYQLTSPE
ncbi:hypothetical protein [Streptomyces iakyrus]